MRIFEIEELPSGCNVTVHQMGKSAENSIDEDMTLLVYNGHMRMLLPTPETTTREWKDWQTQVNRVYEYEWIGWGKILSHDESAPSFSTLEPCAVCGQNARLPKHSFFNPIGGGVDNISQEHGRVWWEEWNPWIYQKPTKRVVQPVPFVILTVILPITKDLGN